MSVPSPALAACFSHLLTHFKRFIFLHGTHLHCSQLGVMLSISVPVQRSVSCGSTDNNHMHDMLKENRCGSFRGSHIYGSLLPVATPMKHDGKRAPVRLTHEHHGMSSAKNLAGTSTHILQLIQHIRLLCEPLWWLHRAGHMRSLPVRTPGTARGVDS